MTASAPQGQQPIIVKELAPGQQIRAEDGIWHAGAENDLSRWMHEDGHRTASDRLIQNWVDTGRAEVLPA